MYGKQFREFVCGSVGPKGLSSRSLEELLVVSAISGQIYCLSHFSFHVRCYSDNLDRKLQAQELARMMDERYELVHLCDKINRKIPLKSGCIL